MHHYRFFRRWMLRGRPGNVNRRIKRTIRRATNAGLTVTSTTGGRHAPTSYHYSGQAVDVSGSVARMVAFQRAEYRRGLGNTGYLELFGPDNTACLKNGRQIALGEGTLLEQLHDNHVHLARR